MLRKLEYHRTVPSGPYARHFCTGRDFQARWKEFIAPVETPGATVLPKATGISWPFASWVKYFLPSDLWGGGPNRANRGLGVGEPGGP